MSDPRLGRLYIPDPRDSYYPMRGHIPKAKPGRNHRYWWDRAWQGNQGRTSQCVAYAWAHFVVDGPVTARGYLPTKDELTEAYQWMQRNDQWAGEEPRYFGTSVRAGADYHRNNGRVSEYRWGWDLTTVLDAVLETGPVVMGTNWYTGMFETNRKGFVEITGRVEGGHAWLLNGVNVNRGVVRGKNSWGRFWGDRGNFWLTIDDLERLLHEDGDACLALEQAA